MAVMRKMLRVAYRLLKSGERYDLTKVWAGAKQQPSPPGWLRLLLDKFYTFYSI
jgi:hypothetical protein